MVQQETSSTPRKARRAAKFAFIAIFLLCYAELWISRQEAGTLSPQAQHLDVAWWLQVVGDKGRRTPSESCETELSTFLFIGREEQAEGVCLLSRTAAIIDGWPPY
jgi:hypothetical protein